AAGAARRRLAELPGMEIPERHFNRGLRHVVAADRLERRKHVAGMLELDAEDARRDELGDDVPDGVVGFRAVVRILFGDAFAVAADAVAVDAHEDAMLVVDASEAGLEEMYERKLQQAQLEAVDLHGAMISSGPL